MRESSKLPKHCLCFLILLCSLTAHAQSSSAPQQTVPEQTVPRPAPPAQPGPTLAKVKAAGKLRCGVDFEEAEYSTEDAHGNHSLFDLDLCKAVAVAVLGPDAKFEAVPFRDERDALAALRAGKMDVLATGSVNYLNTSPGDLGFSQPIFFDTQGLLVNRALGIHSAKDLSHKKVCFLGGTEIEAQAEGYMAREGIAWMPFPFQEEGEMEAAFITGNCAAITADVSQLAYERIAFKNMAKQFEILPDVIAKDPLALTYRADDGRWAADVNAVATALIQAEESGITSANVVAMTKSPDFAVQRLLGAQHGYGQYLGLPDNWAGTVIQSVGNYGEIYERDLGPHSVMALDRGTNNLWTHGGLLYAAPIR